MSSIANANVSSVDIPNTSDRWGFHARGLVGSLFLVTCGVLAAFAAQPIPALAKFEMRLQILGWALFVAGAAFRFWSTLYIGGRKAVEVVSDGPYSVCRNPLYVGTLLVALSFGVMAQSLTILAGVLLATVFYRWIAIPAEEAALAARLGEPFREYCRRTPRFWPRWSQFHTPSELTVNVRALRNELRRAIRWFWTPVLAQLIVLLRAEAWWPHLFWLP